MYLVFLKPWMVRDALRFEVPVFYEDETGQVMTKSANHHVLLLHEIVGGYHRFEEKNLMARLTGPPGEAWLNKLPQTFLILIVWGHMRLPAQALRQFWAEEQHTDWFQRHPIFQDPCKDIWGA